MGALPVTKRSGLSPRSLARHGVVLAAALLMVVPFLWMVLTSLKTLGEATHVPPVILPPHAKWENYRDVLSALPFATLYVNTALMAVGRTAGQLAFCSLAGYAFARLEFPGRRLLFLVCLSVLMVPSQIFLIPQYLIMKELGWLNSLQALIAPGLFSAFGTFLLRQFFMVLPRDLEEAARLDGANPGQIYWYVMLPLAKPGLVALAILSMLWSWNDLLWPLIVNMEPSKMTLAAGIASLQGQYLTDFPLLMAGTVLAILPMVVAFFLLQRLFIEGIALTGSTG